MTDMLILGGTAVPPLMRNVVVFEDSPWRLVRRINRGTQQFEYDLRCGDELVGCVRSMHLGRDWEAYRVRDGGFQWLYLGNDADRAIGALWAAREAL